MKTNKNDYIDAEAVAEAVGRPRMRFVPIKTDAQLDVQSLHRVGESWVGRRTSLIIQIRGLLLERGITPPEGAQSCGSGLAGDPRRRGYEPVGAVTHVAGAAAAGAQAAAESDR